MAEAHWILLIEVFWFCKGLPSLFKSFPQNPKPQTPDPWIIEISNSFCFAFIHIANKRFKKDMHRRNG